MIGREHEERALDGERHHVFLEEELDAVGERLQQAEGADARGSPAVLHAAEDFALQQHRVGDGRQRDDQHDGDLDDGEEQEDLRMWSRWHHGSASSVSLSRRSVSRRRGGRRLRGSGGAARPAAWG